jgi:hypothetical protein
MTKIQTYNLFSVPVSLINLGSVACGLNNELVADVFNEINIMTSKTRSAIDGWQSEGGMEKKYNSFDILRDSIEKSIFATLPRLGFVGDEPTLRKYMCVKDLWFNVLSSPGAFHVPHIHGSGETLFSGVYYPTSGLNTETREKLKRNEDLDSDIQIRASSEPLSGDLMIFDPAGDVKRQTIPSYVNRYPYYGSEICVTPRESMLVVFPAYLSHMVSPIRNVNETRISISFCMMKTS